LFGSALSLQGFGKRFWIAITSIVLLGVIIGVAVGVTNAKSSSAASGTEDSTSASNEPRKSDIVDVIDYLAQSGVSSQNDLERKGTPQNSAATWLAETDGRNIEIPVHESTSPIGYHYVTRYVLAVLWFAMDGGSWSFQTEWMSALDECNWHEHLPVRLPSGQVSYVPAGSYCDDTTGDIIALHLGKGNVQHHIAQKSAHSTFSCICLTKVAVHLIFLDYNNLKGTIPAEIGFLSTLSFLALEGNAIRGGFPPELCNLNQMLALTMMENELVGKLPDCIREMSGLQMLVLSNNYFSDELPDISMLSDMQYLFLDDNKLSGDISNTFDKMSNLRILYLDDNDFSGFIDDTFLAGFEALERIDISGCNLSGYFPSHLLEAPYLQVLDINSNDLEGELPSSLQENYFMQFLAFYNNRMSGPIPPSLKNLTRLFHLDASSNSFTGEFPAFLGEMPELSYLFLAENLFEPGPIPSSFANLTLMQEISLKTTNRTGPIPSYFGDFYSLILLDLDNNDLVCVYCQFFTNKRLSCCEVLIICCS